MLKNRRFMSRLIVSMLVILLMTGCIKKFQTNSAIKSIKKNLAKAEAYDAKNLLEQQYNGLNGDLQSIVNDANANNYKGAVDRAKATKAKVKQFVNDARKANATDLLGKAREEKRIADLNKGKSISVELFSNIEQNLATAEEDNREQKYDKVIDSSKEVITDVSSLLQKNVATTKNQARTLEDNEKVLIETGAETYANAYLSTYRKLRNDFSHFADKERDYINSRMVFKKAVIQFEDTLTETYKGISSELVTYAELQLGIAQEKDADELAKPEYKSANDSFAKILKSHLNQEYEEVVLQKDLFKKQLDSLIKITIERSAKREIQILTDQITSLHENKAEKYLPDMMVKVNETLSQSKTTFDTGAWENAETIAKEGQKYIERIHNEYKNITVALLNQAFSHISQAEDAGALTFAFASLNVARELYKQAKDKLDLLEYDNAIRFAKETGIQADLARNEAYKNRSVQEMTLISQDLEKKILQGVEKYSNQELKESQDLINRMQRLIDEKEYSKAVEIAQITKAKLSFGLQNVITKNNRQLAEADLNIAEAKKYKALKYYPTEVQEAQRIFSTAQNFTRNEQYKESLEAGEKAASHAKETELKSTKAWTLDELKIADTKINDAKNAGADEYATKTFKQAINYYVNSEKLLDQKEYKSALDAAFSSQKFANDAKVFMVTNTKQEIALAIKFLANNYYPSEYIDSLKEYENGTKLLKEGYYVQSRAALERANNSLKKNISDTKKQRINNKLTILNKRFNEMMANHEDLFLDRQFVSLNKEYQTYKTELDPQNFDVSIDKLNQIDSEIDTLKSGQNDFVEKMIRELEEQYTYLLKEERIERFAFEDSQKIKESLKFLAIDLSQENYVDAYGSYQTLQSQLAAVDRILVEKHYFEGLYRLINDVSDLKAEFRTILESGPQLVKTNVYETVKDSIGWNGMVGSISPSKFKLSSQRLFREFQALETPLGLEEMQSHADKYMNAFNTCASYFEKLTLADHLRKETINSMIDKAFRFNRQSEAELDVLEAKIEQFKSSSEQRRDMFTYLIY